jgi:hypothetical protein
MTSVRLVHFQTHQVIGQDGKVILLCVWTVAMTAMVLGTACNIAGGDNSIFTFHTGGNAAFRDMSAFIQPITLTENQPGVFNFEIDVATIIGANGDLIDFGAKSTLHTNNVDSPDDLALIKKLMDNTVEAITIKN